MLTPPAEWTKLALCAEVGGDWWYPEKGQNNTFAISLCRQCPVRVKCLDEALKAGDLFGIWGGLTATERRDVRRFPRRRTA